MGSVPIDDVLIRVRDALATDARVGELGLDVVVEQNVIVVSGAVSAEARRESLCELVAEILREFDIEAGVRDETHVPDASRPTRAPERL